MPLFNEEYRFYGRHAERVVALGRNGYDIFSTTVEIFYTAPWIGYLFDRKEKLDNKSSPKSTTIFLQQLTTYDNAITRAFRTIVLSDTDIEPDAQTRINDMFRSVEVRKDYIAAFEEYLRGGIDILYERLIKDDSEEKEVGDDELALFGRMMDLIDEINAKSDEIQNSDVIKICKEHLNGKKNA